MFVVTGLSEVQIGSEGLFYLLKSVGETCFEIGSRLVIPQPHGTGKSFLIEIEDVFPYIVVISSHCIALTLIKQLEQRKIIGGYKNNSEC